jgi:hypothetical protein
VLTDAVGKMLRTASAARAKRKSRRKPGAQPGHAGHHRRLVPTAAVNAVEVLLPSQCGHCGRRLPQNPRTVQTQGEPRRHQVTELPPIQPHITEIALIALRNDGRRLQYPEALELLPVEANNVAQVAAPAENGAEGVTEFGELHVIGDRDQADDHRTYMT